ncbi:MAG: hypothetical protein WC959_10680 [Kiritimatiellales bacterium]
MATKTGRASVWDGEQRVEVSVPQRRQWSEPDFSDVVRPCDFDFWFWEKYGYWPRGMPEEDQRRGNEIMAGRAVK